MEITGMYFLGTPGLGLHTHCTILATPIGQPAAGHGVFIGLSSCRTSQHFGEWRRHSSHGIPWNRRWDVG